MTGEHGKIKSWFKRRWKKNTSSSSWAEASVTSQSSINQFTSQALNSVDCANRSAAKITLGSSGNLAAAEVPFQPPTELNIAQGLPVAEPPDALAVPAEAFQPQDTAITTSSIPASEIPAIEPSIPSTSSIETAGTSLQERLLIEAYEALKSGEPKVVDAYEKLLSVKVKNINSEPTDEAENRIEVFTQEDWGRMKQMIEDGLEKRERSAAVYKKINDAIQFATPIKPIITQVVQASPPVATAWVGVTLALEILTNPLKESESSISGIAYAVSRMEWYWALVGLLGSTTSNAHVALQRKIEDQFSKLYQKLLLYQMKGICRYFRARFKTFCRDLGKLDDWDGQLEAIKTSEVVLLRDFRTYNDQVLMGDTHEMAGFLKTIDSSAEDIRKGLHYVTSAMECYFKLKEDARKDERYEACRRDLYLTDPEADKRRIIDSKDGLVKASYEWILHLPEFQRWKTNPESRRLWIRGDPGKGKTMLLCGIIEELERNRLERLCYFFCQATMPKLNNATSVLRGLVYQLIKKYPWLIDSVLAEYNDSGRQCFEDHNAWQTISKILLNILRDPCMNGVLLIVDALDECIDFKDRRRLLGFIDRASSEYDAKWIISSRNWQDIEETLDINTSSKHTLSLEMNQRLISDAVKEYIKARVTELARLKKFDTQTSDQVEQHLIKNSNDTFLWVALVCEALRDVATYEISVALKSFPAGLAEMYERMMPNDTTTATDKLRAKVLAIISVIKRPVTPEELPNIVQLPSHVSGNTESVEQLVKSCGSFLNIQNGTIYFVHQSAADFLRERAFKEFPDIGSRHLAVTRHSLHVLAESEVLKRDIYEIKEFGTSIEDVTPPNSNLQSFLAYSCVYWADHLCESIPGVQSNDSRDNDISESLAFLEERFLYWVEALVLLRHVSEGIQAMQRLEMLIEPGFSKNAKALLEFVRNAIRFVLYNREVMEKYPLQLYASSLAFCPLESVVRRHFGHDIPEWITRLSGLDSAWNSCLQTIISGRNGNALAFSNDGKWLASTSTDNEETVIKIWEAGTGILARTLEGDFHNVPLVSFSGDSKKPAQLAVACKDNSVQIWDLDSGNLLRTLCNQTETSDSKLQPLSWNIIGLKLSSDGCKVASDHLDGELAILDAESGEKILSIPEHHRVVWPDTRGEVTFSPDSSLIAESWNTGTVTVWDVHAAHSQRILDGRVTQTSNPFSSDSSLLALVADENRRQNIYVWEISTGSLRQKIVDEGSGCMDLAFSPKVGSQHLAVASDRDINIWDVATGTSVWKVSTAAESFFLLSFSPDGQRLASLQSHDAIRIWDVSVRSTTSRENKSATAKPVCSPDGSQGIYYHKRTNTIRTRNIEAGWQDSTISLKEEWYPRLAFSNDKSCIACKVKGEIMLFDATDQCLLQTIPDSKKKTRLTCFAISGDAKYVAYACTKKMKRMHEVKTREAYIQVWDAEAGKIAVSIDVDYGHVIHIAFSSDSQKLAAAAQGRIQVWEIPRGVCLWTLRDTIRWPCYAISFDTNISTRLHTQFGFVDLNSESLDNSGQETSIAKDPFSGYGVAFHKTKTNFDHPRSRANWLMRDGKKVLRVPADYEWDNYGFEDIAPIMNGTILIWASRQLNGLMRIELKDPWPARLYWDSCSSLGSHMV